MREGWIATNLVNVCTLQRGFDLPKNERTTGAVPLMSSSGCIDSVAVAKVIGPGVVTGRSGSIGRVYFIDNDFWPLNTTLYVKDFHGNWPRFIYYLLSNFDLRRFTSGVGVPTLNRNHVHSEIVRIPTSIGEQKRIVAILDEAFAGIAAAVANTEKNLANARELFESYRDTVFGATPDDWIERTLGDVCTIKHGFAFKSKYFGSSGAHVVLTPGSFFEDGGFRDQGQKTKYYNGEIPPGFILNKGDFLIAMTEQAVGLLGSSLMVPEAERYLHNQRLGRVQIRDGVAWHNDFFFHQFNTRLFREAVQSTASGVKVRHTSPAKLGAIPIKYPPTKAQQESVANALNELLDESRRLEGVLRQKSTALAELKQSLLQKAFSGELTAAPHKEIETALA